MLKLHQDEAIEQIRRQRAKPSADAASLTNSLHSGLKSLMLAPVFGDSYSTLMDNNGNSTYESTGYQNYQYNVSFQPEVAGVETRKWELLRFM
jgi:hypothetical protein